MIFNRGLSYIAYTFEWLYIITFNATEKRVMFDFVSLLYRLPLSLIYNNDSNNSISTY